MLILLCKVLEQAAMYSPEKKEYIAEISAFSSDMLYFIMIIYWFTFAFSG